MAVAQASMVSSLRPRVALPQRAQRRVVLAQAVPRDAVQAPETVAARPQLIGQSRRSLLLGAVVGSICSCCAPPQPAQASDWGYTCPGPDAWEGACKIGEQQSPIDIPIPTPLDQIKFNYPATVTGTVINNGHGSPQFNVASEDVRIVMNGETYQLVQLHFHAPSEHTFDGRHALMEAHFVHKNVNTGDLAVLGVMLEAGAPAPNPVLEAVMGAAPAKTGMVMPLAKPIALQALLPKARSSDGRRAYAMYDGSLTTPPCTEGVNWVVFLDPVKVQATQVLDFMGFGSGGATLGYNSRPVQPLGARQLRFFA